MQNAPALKLRETLNNGPALGPFMKSCDPAFVETAGYAGFDFVILDMEHGPAGLAQTQNNIRAAALGGVSPIVRVPRLDETVIGQALDIGAAGVQVPQIGSAAEAALAVRAAKFHPQGARGVCRFVRAAGYSSTPREEYFPKANAETLVILQLEGLDGLAELDDILATPGLDVLFIGPYDLSQSLGLPGQTSHPRVVEEMQKIVKRAAERQVITGVFADSAETRNLWLSAGVRYLAYSVDVGIFYEACTNLVSEFKGSKQ